ncbi:MAG: DUF4364 family protein [Oscillospiraceae bacterium]|nr:DUF4364 family protein [Oscillospiraceae bacterium]
MDNYLAGVGPGGIREIYDAKILICYTLSCIKDKITKEQMASIFYNEGFVNYFLFSDAIGDLLKSNHISIDEYNGKKFLKIQNLGIETADRLRNNIPNSLRKKVVRLTVKFLAEYRKNKDYISTIHKVEDGYVLECRITDIGTDLLSFKIFAPDINQAEFMESKFKQSPIEIYKIFLNTISDIDL